MQSSAELHRPAGHRLTQTESAVGDGAEHRWCVRRGVGGTADQRVLQLAFQPLRGRFSQFSRSPPLVDVLACVQRALSFLAWKTSDPH